MSPTFTFLIAMVMMFMSTSLAFLVAFMFVQIVRTYEEMTIGDGIHFSLTLGLCALGSLGTFLGALYVLRPLVIP